MIEFRLYQELYISAGSLKLIVFNSFLLFRITQSFKKFYYGKFQIYVMYNITLTILLEKSICFSFSVKEGNVIFCTLVVPIFLIDQLSANQLSSKYLLKYL